MRRALRIPLPRSHPANDPPSDAEVFNRIGVCGIRRGLGSDRDANPQFRHVFRRRKLSTLEQSRHLATDIPGPLSQELIKRKTAAVSRGIGNTMPVYTARAGGGIVEDVDGNRLIDLGSGIAVTTIGNSSPRVVDAVRKQVDDFTHTCFMITPYEEYVAVAEHLNRLAPGSSEKRSVLFNSGAEAVENAVKIARAYTHKDAVVAFDHAYHGRTNMTMALTAKSKPYKSGFRPFPPEIYRAPLAYPIRP